MANLSNQQDKVLLAYLADWANWDGDKMDVTKLTHINYAFALVKDGRVVGDHLKKTHWFKEFKKKNPDLKIVISIGGWGADGFSDAALTDESRSLFAETAIELMQEHDFDGLDLDWEYPCHDWAGIVARPEDKQNYTKLVQLLRERLDALTEKTGQAYLLTMAAGAAKMFADDMELDLLVPCFDFINLMTYDFYTQTSSIAGHHTNLFESKEDLKKSSGANTVDIFMEAGVPAEKLVLGAAFYGRGWSGLDSSKHPIGQSGKPAKGFHWNNKDQVMDKDGLKRCWDEAAKAPYLWNGDTFITYDDPESMMYKAQYVNEKGIRGIMFWEWSEDKDNELLNAIYDNLNK